MIDPHDPSSSLSAPLSRRTFLRAVGIAAAGAPLVGCATRPVVPASDSRQLIPEVVNDVHSQLNLTTVAGVRRPRSEQDVVELVRDAAARPLPLSVCGGRHAGGGQQFLSNRVLVDLTGLDGVAEFDPRRGQISIGAGAFWPAVITAIHSANAAHGTNWSIHQKQGGADALSLGGAVSANVHGRCLDSAPIVQDIESLRVVTSGGRALTLSRTENADLFRLAVGGYGLFAVITQVTLRLVPRQKLRLCVERATSADLIALLDDRRRAGAMHGDWQISIDPAGPQFLRDGILTTYVPVAGNTPITRPQSPPDPAELTTLATMAHVEPARAFEIFAQSWQQRTGQVDWSDSWQTGDYVPGYHTAVDARLHVAVKGTEALSEFYVPRRALAELLARSATWLRESNAKLIYSVVRLIKRDTETYLAWACEDQACLILNLHVDHTPDEIARVNTQLRGIAQIALDLGGRFYLTYGRFASPAQLLAGYPQLPEFLALKRTHDPRELFQSDWYRWVNGSTAPA